MEEKKKLIIDYIEQLDVRVKMVNEYINIHEKIYKISQYNYDINFKMEEMYEYYMKYLSTAPSEYWRRNINSIMYSELDNLSIKLIKPIIDTHIANIKTIIDINDQLANDSFLKELLIEKLKKYIDDFEGFRYDERKIRYKSAYDAIGTFINNDDYNKEFTNDIAKELYNGFINISNILYDKAKELTIPSVPDSNRDGLSLIYRTEYDEKENNSDDEWDDDDWDD